MFNALSAERAALMYGERGFAIFPCSADAKNPLIKDWQQKASTDPDVIRAWWRQWPKAMIGMPLGQRAGCFVVDLDPADGHEWTELAEDVAAVWGSKFVRDLPISQTANGGVHLWFAMPGDGERMNNRVRMIVNERGQCDVRGDGGYVVVAPSVRKGPRARDEGCEGKAYLWLGGYGLDDHPFKEPPAELVALARKDLDVSAAPRPALPVDRPSPTTRFPDRAYKIAAGALQGETDNVRRATRGARNDTLNRAALKLGHYVFHGLVLESVAVAHLFDAAVSSGLVKDDGPASVQATIASGIAAAAKMGKTKPIEDILKDRPGFRPSPSRPAAPPLDAYEDTLARFGASRGGRWGASEGASEPAAGADADRDGQPWGGDQVPDDGTREGDTWPADEPPQGGGGRTPGTPPLDGDVLRRLVEEPANDEGNGVRLRAWFGDEFLIVRQTGAYYWNATRWRFDGGDEKIRMSAHQVSRRIGSEAAFIFPSPEDQAAMKRAEPLLEKGDDELSAAERQTLEDGLEAEARLKKRRTDRLAFARSSGNRPRISGMIEEAAPYRTVPPEQMDADALTINCLNGTLKIILTTEDASADGCSDPVKKWAISLNPHDRNDHCSRIIGAAYDPTAQCPEFLAFLTMMQPRQPVRRYLQVFHGYAMSGMTGEQLFPYHYGLGANGKSTFMETMGRLAGSYSTNLPAEALTGDMQRRGDQASPEFARLPGVRLVRCAELPRGQSLKEAVIKQLTGGEPILTRHLHKGFFEFKPSFKVIGSGNDRPPIGGVDEGIWRRIKLIPWTETIPRTMQRPMEEVLATFAKEASGILNWLLEGLLEYLESGLPSSSEIDDATLEYRADMDPVGQFVTAHVNVKEGADVTARALYTAYVAWAHVNSVRPFTEKGFAAIMTQKGFRKVLKRVRLYKDIELHDVPNDPEDDHGHNYQSEPD